MTADQEFRARLIARYADAYEAEVERLRSSPQNIPVVAPPEPVQADAPDTDDDDFDLDVEIDLAIHCQSCGAPREEAPREDEGEGRCAYCGVPLVDLEEDSVHEKPDQEEEQKREQAFAMADARAKGIGAARRRRIRRSR
jgi:hypothetical protein